MKFRFLNLTFASALGVAVFTASAFALSYVVKRGDTLSSIAKEQIPGRVYGDGGGIQKLIDLNPQIKNADLIFPGDKIVLASENLQLSESTSTQDVTRAPAQETQGTSVQDQAIAAAPAQSSDDEGYSLIEVVPNFFYTRIDGKETSNGTTAKLLSKLNYGLSASWRHLWSESFESFVLLSVNRYDFNSSTSRTLEGENFTNSGIEAGARWKLKPQTALMVSLAAQEEICYRSSAPTTVKIDSVMVPRLNLGLSNDLYSKKPFTLGAELKASVLSRTSSDDYDIKPGWAYVGRIFVRQEPKNSSLTLSTGLFYGQHFQKTSALDLTRTDLGLDLGLRWSFGK